MHDRHVLITGGSGGLGTKVTAHFVALGAQVTVPIFAPTETARLEAELGDEIDKITVVEADHTDEDAVQALIAGMTRLDALVHLVGGFAMGPTDEFTTADFRTQLELNVITAFITIKHALIKMKQPGYGRIVTVASKAALTPPAQMAAYAAAKAGVLALTQSVASETVGTAITANCVLPSVIDTPANRAAMGDGDVDQWVNPERLAATIGFLASDAAGDLRGSTVRVYAGS